MITNKQLSEANVQFLGGLIKKVNEITDVIDDNNIKTNGTYSSLKIYEVVQEAIKTSKDYTLEEIAKLSGASYSVVNTVDEMTDQRIIYLLDNGTNFDIYIVQGDGSATPIGTTDINLTDYYTKSEVDNEFLKKTDATGTYATVSALGNIENDVDVHINDTIAHMTQTEKNNIVGKDKIVTTLDGTVTNEQVPSAKIIYDEFISDKMKDYCVNMGDSNASLSKYGIDDITNLTGLLSLTSKLPPHTRLTIQINTANKQTFYDCGVTPVAECGLLVITIESWRGKAIFTTDNFLTYVATTYNAQTEWTKWQRVCTTTVADVSRTFMPLPDGNSGELSYIIKNGFATITVFNLTIATSPLVVTGLPIPATYVANPVVSADGMNVGGSICYSDNDKFVIYGTPGTGMYGVVTYPVAE